MRNLCTKCKDGLLNKHNVQFPKKASEIRIKDLEQMLNELS